MPRRCTVWLGPVAFFLLVENMVDLLRVTTDYSGVHDSGCFEREQDAERHTARRLIQWLHCLLIPVTASNPYITIFQNLHQFIKQQTDLALSNSSFSFWAPRVEPRNTQALRRGMTWYRQDDPSPPSQCRAPVTNVCTANRCAAHQHEHRDASVCTWPDIHKALDCSTPF